MHWLFLPRHGQPNREGRLCNAREATERPRAKRDVPSVGG